MQQVLDTLNNLTPVLAIVSMAVFMTLERWIPYFEHGAHRKRQRWRNVGMVAIAFPTNAVLGTFMTLPVIWSEENRFGLLYRLPVWAPVSIVLGILVIDLSLYTQHIIMHKVPALWRIHRVHHADTDLDASSGLRLHPLELFFLLLMPALVMALLGVSMASFVFYNTLALPWFLVNHSNIRYPAGFERWGSLLMSTPNWHRVHHSSYQPETDSHYGCVFSIWDRLFGTTRKTQVEKIRFGLDRFREPDEQTIWKLLKMPFTQGARR